MDTLIIAGWSATINGKNDENPGLTSKRSIYEEYSMLKRTDSYTNTSDSQALINRILSKFIYQGTIKSIIYQTSEWCNENHTIETNGFEELHIASSGTRTTQYFNPFIIIDSGTMQYSLHILPVGDWEINIIRNLDSDDTYEITLGLKGEGLSMTVQPGETIALPVILVHSTGNNDIWGNSCVFQKFLNDIIYDLPGKEIPLPYNSWFYDFDKFYVNDLRKQAAAAKALGMETFIVDAGWYGPSNDDWSLAAGDWREKEKGAFRGNMKGFSEYVNSIGLDFGLWIEAEKVCEGVPVLKERPELFLKASKGIYYPDLSKDEAVGYLYKTISHLIEKYNVKWFKLDFNFPLGVDPHKSSYFRYMRGYQSLMVKLHTAFPMVIFEACESGAMRADLEVNRFFDIQFLSDSARPVTMLEIFKNSLLWFTPAKLFKWIVLREIDKAIPEYGIPLESAPARIIVPQGPTWNHFESCDISVLGCLSLLFHTGFSGDIAGLTDYNRKALAKYIKLYKELRPALMDSVVYRHPVPIGWLVFDVRKDKEENPTIVIAFKLESEKSECSINIPGKSAETITFKLNNKFTADYKLL